MDKTIFISSLNGNINITESKRNNSFQVSFQKEGDITINENIFIAGFDGAIDISIPEGFCQNISFQDVKGDIDIDLPSTYLNKLQFLGVKGNIEGNVKYHQIDIQDLRGGNYLGRNKPFNKTNHQTIVKTSFSKKESKEDRTNEKDWKW